VAAEFELLSIDIDSWDYHIWSSLERYQPKVVIIEINSSFPPGLHLVHNPPYVQGSSFSAMLELGRNKGYTLVCHTGNMIFVRNDGAAAVGLDGCFLRNPELLFLPRWLSSAQPSIGQKIAASAKQRRARLLERFSSSGGADQMGETGLTEPE
jgi:hypothetical protein